MKLIGITGRAGSGKDTLATMIENAIPAAVKYSWATPLKEFAEAIFLFPWEWLWGESQLRNAVLTTGPGYWNATTARFWNLGPSFHREWLACCGRSMGRGGSAFIDWFGSIRRQCETDPSKLTPRHVLQQLGTEFGRKCIDPDVWIKVGRNRLDACSAPVGIIPDCRFDNEAQGVLNGRGEIWKVHRNGPDNAVGHESEAGISTRFITRTFPNFGTLESLRAEVTEALYLAGLT